MGILDRFKSHKAAQDKARQMTDAAEKQANDRTGNKYESQVDSAQQNIEGRIGMDRRDKPGQP